MNIHVAKIQKCSTHDGPGIRTVVFLKGCPLRCAWCHNPETQRPDSQIFYHARDCIHCLSCIQGCVYGAHTEEGGQHIYHPELCRGCMACSYACPTGACEAVGSAMDIGDCLDAALKDCAFYGETGGITLSGGEPMFQPEPSIRLIQQAKEHRLTTAVETCGYFEEKYVGRLCRYTDTLLWDIKDTDSARHKRFTGVGTEQIIRNLFLADRAVAHIILRCIVINGVNAQPEHFKRVAELYHSLRHCDAVELIAYHVYGSSKHMLLYGRENAHTEWIPAAEQMRAAQEYLTRAGCRVVL